MPNVLLTSILLAASVLPAAAGPKWGHPHHRPGHHHGHYVRPAPPPRVYYAPPPRAYYGPPRGAWVPSRSVIPVYYRSQIAPLPVQYGPRFGPPPPGCRWGYYNGYAVAYRPSNFLVVQFGRVW